MFGLISLIAGVLSCVSFLGVPLLYAAETVFCAVCQKGPLTGKVWLFKKSHICGTCFKIKTRCAHCGLPTKSFERTSDGRVICRKDVPNALLTQEQLERLFEKTRIQLREVFGPVLDLKHPSIAVKLYDIDYWNHEIDKQDSKKMARMGFSHTRSQGGEMVHSILLLSGQPREDAASVVTHEYMHLWINENSKGDREFDHDTLEAVCELVAYKYNAGLGNSKQQRKIVSNPYTKGQINELIHLDQQHGFSAILDWVRNATTPKPNVKKLAKFTPQWSYAATAVARRAPQPKPTKLQLKGILGGGRNRIALINNKPMSRGESAKIEIGEEKVLVHCAEVTPDSVKLLVGDERSPLTLQLATKL